MRAASRQSVPAHHRALRRRGALRLQGLPADGNSSLGHAGVGGCQLSRRAILHRILERGGLHPRARRGVRADPKDAKAEKTPARANEQLDALTRQQGQFQKADVAKLDECLKKQDSSAIKPMQVEGEGLGLGSTPTLFINGDKIDGAVPVTVPPPSTWAPVADVASNAARPSLVS